MTAHLPGFYETQSQVSLLVHAVALAVNRNWDCGERGVGEGSQEIYAYHMISIEL